MDCTQEYKLYLSLTIMLTVLLLMSEFLAWSKSSKFMIGSCKANGISQVLLKCHSSAGDLEFQTDRRPSESIRHQGTIDSPPISC